MLVDEIVKFCDSQYEKFADCCGKGVCNHPSGQCSGSCYNCLYHIHYPEIAPRNSKKLYDCPKMLCHYVCQYSYLYVTELLCALREENNFLKKYPYFHALSLGCGGCADLMALECFCHEEHKGAQISYVGIDVNALWTSIHEEIKDYCQKHNMCFQTKYNDVFEYFQGRCNDRPNIIVISYLISYLYNTQQIEKIDALVGDIIEKVIRCKDEETPILLIVNDVNSNKRGRDYFEHFEKKISQTGLSIIKKYRYFDKSTLNDFQKIGEPYPINECFFDIPRDIQEQYHAQTGVNATIQLLLEVN